ncbi:PAS domain S-box protein [Fulvivirga sp. M361]|uniref:sensor histidine kinase n=1 Tax=Fulvivirga sp. M361 TaxID=2594266 RepID=UPI001179C678|nr:7TM diverse intracellular signaling domain-containing protein [Fulvivirga sp. M361]TRX62643.1 PAS domain S-box protein [Fulvivirga sp. M361]
MRSYFLFVVAFIPAILFGQGKTLSIRSLHKGQNINSYLSYLIDEDRSLTHSDVLSLSDSAFKKISEEGLRLPLTKAHVWLRLRYQSHLPRPESVLIDFYDPSIHTIELFQRWPNGGHKRSITGAGIHPYEKDIRGNRNNLLLHLKPGVRSVCIFKISSPNYMTVSAQLIDDNIALERNTTERTALGLYYGALLMIFIYNLLLFISSRLRIFLLSAIYVSLIAVFTGAADGFTPQYLYFLVDWTNGYQDAFTAALVNILGLLFMLDFLQVSTWSMRYHKFLHWSVYTIIAIMVILLIADLQQAYFVLSLIGMAVLLITIHCSLIALKRKVPQAQYFVAAYAVYAIFITIFILSIQRVIPYGPIPKYSIHFGFIGCIIVLSYGLGMRVYKSFLTYMDREKEKHETIEKKNQELELKVTERTRDIEKKEINLRSILDNSDNSIWLLDKNYFLIDFNLIFKEEWKLAYGIELEVGMNLPEHIPDEATRVLWECRYSNALKGEKAVYQDSYQVGHENNYYEIHVYPIKDGGEITGISFFAKDITKRTQAQKKLVEQNKVLKKVNRELDSFVYSASHDLKAPLASVLGLIDLVKKENEQEVRYQYYGMMQRSIARLDQFINDIIDYSRNARMDIKPEEIDLREVVCEIFEDLKYMQGVEDLEREIEIVKGLRIKTDPIRLKIIARNLLSNAIRYGRLGKGIKKIHVKAAVENDVLKIVVKDHGQGIPKDRQEKIFEMFYRADENISGSGLGLYIVKETLNRLNGKIEVASDYGMGAEFKVEIPVSK